MTATVLAQVDTQILILLSGLIIPLIHGLIAKADASDETKVLITLALTGITGLVSALLADEGALTTNLLVSWGTSFVVTVTTHYGLYKPIGVSGSTGTIQRMTGGKGIAPLG